MATLLQYLYWRGDLPFEAAAFNEVDAAVLARLSYLPLERVMAAVDTEDEKPKSMSISDAMHALSQIPQEHLHFLWKDDPKLIRALLDSHRFGELELIAFAQKFDIPTQTQFAVVSIRLPEHKIYVSYRGTDDTLVGWQEDLNMGFTCPVPAQELAVAYLETLAAVDTTARLIPGGHSKGGNLAVYASAFVSPALQERVEVIYNFDGPGFVDQVLQAPGYMAICNRVQTFVPQTSIVGMLLGHQEKHTIVHSIQKGVMQHDLYSWNVRRDGFVCLQTVDKTSRFIDTTLKDWMTNMDTEKRSQFVETLYTVLSATGAKTIGDLSENWFSYARRILRSIRDLDEPTRRATSKVLRQLLRSTKTGLAQINEKETVQNIAEPLE